MIIDLDLQGPMNFIIDQHTNNSKKPEGRFRKNPLGGTKLPYFFHPIEGSILIWKWGAGRPHMMKGFLGHDLYEDTNVTEEQVIENLGPAANLMIHELTFDETKQTKEEYLADFANKTVESVVGKVADRIINTNDFLLGDKKYAKKYWSKAETLFAIYDDRVKLIAETFDLEVVLNINKSILAIENQL